MAFGLGTKLALLFVVPMLALGIVAISVQHYISDVGDQAIMELRSSHMQDHELSKVTRSLRAQIAKYTKLLRLYFDNHQKALLSDGHVLKQSIILSALKTQSTQLASKIAQKLEPLKELMAQSAEAAGAHAPSITTMERDYLHVVRLARTLPTLSELVIDSHEGTVAFLKAGDFDQARAQFIYEERERALAFQSAAELAYRGHRRSHHLH